MTHSIFEVGTILANSVGQFTKVISFSNGRYGLSGWVASRTNAEKATVAFKFVNTYGLDSMNVQSVKSSSKSAAPAAPKASSDAKPTKSKLSKLSAEKVKSMTAKLGLSTDGSKADMLKKLFAHYEL